MAAERKRIGLREVRALRPGEEVWDSTVVGFGARRQRSDAVAYVLLFRTREGRSRRYTIGRHGSPWTPDTAREESKRLLGLVAAGEDPAVAKREARSAASVSELCDHYLADAEAGRLLTRLKAPKKASTLLSDRGRIERHIKPILGKLSVPAVTREDVDSFMHKVAAGATAARKPTGRTRGLSNVRGGKGVASRSVGLLGAIFTYAVRKRLRVDNPVRGVTRFADGRRERRLNEAEYQALGRGLVLVARPKATKTGSKVIKADGGMWPPALAAIRFLALTGWRSGEAMALRLREVDLVRQTAVLLETKSGESVRPLSFVACEVLREATKGRGENDLIFPPTRGLGRMTGFSSLFARVVAAAELPADITPHVLRHSFASVAGDLGFSETTIGALLGHRGRSITSRYVHSADAVLLAAADTIATHIQDLMNARVHD